MEIVQVLLYVLYLLGMVRFAQHYKDVETDNKLYLRLYKIGYLVGLTFWPIFYVVGFTRAFIQVIFTKKE